MRSYRWVEHGQFPLSERYPKGLAPIAGLARWQAGASNFGTMTDAEMRLWLDDLVKTRSVRYRARCPRVFISHRRCDLKLALQVAYEAHLSSFDYWLDVIDLAQDRPPHVQTLEASLGRSLSDLEFGILTAAIIEMALLNSTHVVAIMTGATAGSQWVPYEYGRVKQRMPAAENAVTWRDKGTLPLKSLPEYLHLSPVCAKRSELHTWLSVQRAAYHACLASSHDPWQGQPAERLSD
jgi:hypothetical protein